jgi:hypothetical protein
MSIINSLVDLVPKSVLTESGAVFYSGRTAFTSPSPLYILGLNPGGSTVLQSKETVERDIKLFLEENPSEWSAYSDESWAGRPAGTCGLQPRVLHMLRGLGMNPRLVPSSNVAFVRSPTENTMPFNFDAMAYLTWPFHQQVIDQLGVKVILCFGQAAGYFVARRLNATSRVGRFVEQNNRRWTSEALANNEGKIVVIATHPSRADWTSPSADPTPLVLDALAR